MAQVPEKVLSWLYSSLHEYYDARRTYSDTAKVLATYHPSISPRTETYTYENGAPALLLTLTGTIPVAFRGATYRCPVKLWIPHNYPHEPPMTYVNPGKEMVIRPGQHVGIDGRVYHPYLRDWSRIWDRSSIWDFLGILQQVFAKEPPVISKAQQQQYQRPIGQSQQPAPPPQLPPKQRHGAEPIEMPSINTPPPRPPKPGESANEPSRDISRDGPPLPPLPPEAMQNRRTSDIAQASSARGQPQAYQSPPPGYHNGRPPGPRAVPPPLSPQHLLQPQPRPSNADRSPVSPLSPMNGHSEAREERNLQYPPYRQSQPQPLYNNAVPQAGPYQHFPQASGQQQLPRQYQPASQQVIQPKKQPPPDLLSDPFDVALPSLTPAGPPPPAPPIPPNPEKEHLLHAISSTLVQQARQRVNQNMAAIQPLQAQQNALQAAHGRLEAEIRQLEQLDSALSSNEAILRRSIQDCDRTISTAKSKKQPPIDEVLIAPTMVANQLWTLCAEEAACREAMYVLQKAVDRGRVSGNDFVRQMRGLGRECFLKMALARKCAKGMGLDAPPPR